MYASNLVWVRYQGAFSNVCVCFNYIYVIVFTGWSRSIRDQAYLEIYIYMYVYTKRETHTKKEERLIREWKKTLPWILLTSRYILWQRIFEKLRNIETNECSNIAVVSSLVYFLLARSGGEKISAEEIFSTGTIFSFDPLPVKQFRDLSTYPCRRVAPFLDRHFDHDLPPENRDSPPPPLLQNLLAISLTFDQSLVIVF